MDIVIKETLAEATKVTARCLLDKHEVPFTLISVEFKTAEIAKKFFERITACPFWLANCDAYSDQSKVKKRIQFFLIDDKEIGLDLSVKAKDLLGRIELYAKVGTTVFPDGGIMENFSFAMED